MTPQKCVHKGCGKVFTDPEEPCIYHPGPPEFHEGQKGWKCCKPRFLTFDEFLSIPPCTTGKHSSIDDTPAAPARAPEPDTAPTLRTRPIPEPPINPARAPQAQPTAALPAATAAPESDSDDPALEIPAGKTCRRRGCGATFEPGKGRDEEVCVYHPGSPVFHEGTKGWTCCKPRVHEFDEFMALKGCTTKPRHMFVGSGKKKAKTGGEEEVLESVRNDFYQTPTTLIASFFLKKIDSSAAKITFEKTALELDLPTSDRKRWKTTIPLFGSIDPEKSTFKIMSTKLEVSLLKADGSGWPVLRSDEKRTGEIIQTGRAGKA